MNKRLVLPKKAFRLSGDIDEPRLYFLAGPIVGGGDWQSTATHRLLELDPGCYIVCPRRYSADHPMSNFAIKTDVGLPTSQIEYESQTAWERHYLKMASKHGAIIFWLGIEDKDNPRPKEDGPYAQDTYGELGRWSISSARDGANVVVGAQPRFPGRRTIQENFELDHKEYDRSFTILKTLEETLQSAVKLAKNIPVDHSMHS